ncbi:hypothetical protein VZT92_019218 [Zoarces viviparus]|uniref:Uncharacterized protein n=1 Tax=Zoarces viviparus TaxID=48416 RepID=A0AAW1EL43_ZOAVI
MRGNTDQNVAEPSLPSQKQQAKGEADSAEASITSLPSANKTDCVITVTGQQGSDDPAGLQQGLTWWMLLLSQHRITKEHKLPFKLLPAGVHKAFQEQPSLEPTL